MVIFHFQLSVSVVLARGLVCDELKLLSQQDQLVIVEMVPYRTLEILADSCQADMVTYLTLASEVSLSQQDQLVIIEMVPYRTLEILADSCQADMVAYLILASEVSLSRFSVKYLYPLPKGRGMFIVFGVDPGSVA